MNLRKLLDREWWWRKFVRVAGRFMSESDLKRIVNKHEIRMAYEYIW